MSGASLHTYGYAETLAFVLAPLALMIPAWLSAMVVILAALRFVLAQ